MCIPANSQQCDELRPKCSACSRHKVACEYVTSDYSSTVDTTPTNDYDSQLRGSPYHAWNDRMLDGQIDPTLEIRLMHEWTAHACKTFSTAWDFWMYQAPLIAFEFRHVLDAILAVTALHASRQPPMKWIPGHDDGHMVPIRYDSITCESVLCPQPSDNAAVDWNLAASNNGMDPARNIGKSGNHIYLAANRSKEMLAVSRFYFDRAIDGHRRALNDLSIQNIEAIYLTSILVSFHAIFVLSESEEDSTLPSLDPVLWLRLSSGTRFICAKWREMIGPDWMDSSGVFYGKPDLSDSVDIFNSEHGRPFLGLLTYGEDFEFTPFEDRQVYHNVISYIGAIYKGIVEATESPMASCRRIIGLPSRNDPRFVDFVETKQPRALAILAHLFACMRLVSTKIQWFDGIAERQIPRIYEQLPLGWRGMLAWPCAIMNGEIDRQPKETYIDDILVL